ncbi:hypothetical protein ETH_00002350, partial [Eimeria tenella]
MESEKEFAKKCEEYAEAQGLRELLQQLLRLLLLQQPQDPLQYLIDYLKQLQDTENSSSSSLSELLQQQQQQQQEQQQQQQQQQRRVGPPLTVVVLGLPGSSRSQVSVHLAKKWGLEIISAKQILKTFAEKHPKSEAAKAV